MSSLKDLPIEPSEEGNELIVKEYIKERDAITTIENIKDHVHRWRHLWNLKDNHGSNEDILYNEKFDPEEALSCLLKIRNAGECKHVGGDQSCCGTHISIPYVLMIATMVSRKYCVATDIALIQLYGHRRPKMNLSPQNVENTFLDCLYTDQEVASLTEEEIKKQATIVEGIVQTVGFNPTRLEIHKQDITDMLQELPDSFMKGKGGGMSFLNACNNKDGELWTGEHRIMEQLFMMGIAIKKVQECMPRQMWSLLPGGVPYYTVDINA